MKSKPLLPDTSTFILFFSWTKLSKQIIHTLCLSFLPHTGSSTFSIWACGPVICSFMSVLTSHNDQHDIFLKFSLLLAAMGPSYLFPFPCLWLLPQPHLVCTVPFPKTPPSHSSHHLRVIAHEGLSAHSTAFYILQDSTHGALPWPHILEQSLPSFLLILPTYVHHNHPLYT